jgi:hypothetical protein
MASNNNGIEIWKAVFISKVFDQVINDRKAADGVINCICTVYPSVSCTCFKVSVISRKQRKKNKLRGRMG